MAFQKLNPMKRQLFKIFSLIFLLQLAAVNLYSQSAAVKNMRAQAGELQKEIAEKEKILLSSQKDVKSRLNNLQLINAQISQRRNFIALLQREVRALDTELKSIGKEIKMYEADVENSRQEYAEALRRARKYNNFASKMLFVFSANDFNSMLRRYRYTGEYMNAHLILADSLKSKIAQLESKRSELQATRALKEESLQQQRQEQEKLRKLETEQKGIVKALQRDYKKVEAELKKKRSELKKLNAAIEREIERVLAAERAAAAKKKSGSKKGSGSGSKKAESGYNSDEGVAKMSGSFLNNKKKMPVPITGPYLVVGGYGVKNAISGKGNVPINTGGITFEGSKGAKARCIFDGKVTAVVSSGTYSFVLVRHGKYISVYCNLVNVRVKGGENIKAGDIIGDIEPDAKEGNPRMLFQIRQERKTLNPAEWIKM